MTTDVVRTQSLDAVALDQIFREARTANSFSDRPVSDEEIRAIYDLAKWGPTAFNQQPLRGVVVRSQDARDRLIPLMGGANQAKTASAPAVLILAADNDFHDRLPGQFPVFPEAKDVFFSERAAREPSAVLNAALQVAYLIVSVRALGLAAGPMNGFDADAVSREFFPNQDARALVVLNIGEPGPDAWFDRLPRLDFDEAFRIA